MSYNYNDDDNYQGDEYAGPSKYDTTVKRCRKCDREVEMSTDHGVCDSCASQMERGIEW
jgi:rRNA maturation endonuclease Nob1